MTSIFSYVLAGVGETGVRVVRSLSAENRGRHTWAIDLEPRIDEAARDAARFALDAELPDRSIVPLGDADYERAIGPLADTLTQQLGQADCRVVLVAFLGGRVGACALPVLLSLLSIPPERLCAVVLTPFPFEGPMRSARAASALSEIEARVSLTRHVSSRELLEVAPTPIPMTEAYEVAEARLLGAVRELLQGDSV
jgi:hypothetical protein